MNINCVGMNVRIIGGFNKTIGNAPFFCNGKSIRYTLVICCKAHNSAEKSQVSSVSFIGLRKRIIKDKFYIFYRAVCHLLRKKRNGTGTCCMRTG